MDEQEQNEGIKRTSETLKQKDKEQQKNRTRQFFKTIIGKKKLRILLICIIAATILTVFLYTFSWLLNLTSSKNSKQSSAEAIVYTYTSQGDGPNNDDEITGYMVNPTIDAERKGYKLEYIYRDEEGNDISEDTVLQELRSELEDEDKDINSLTQSELKIIAVLANRGLDTADYSVEDLKCLALFVKAQIAGENFDLRTGDDLGKEVDTEDIAASDLIYGTLQAQRTNVIVENGEAKYNTVPLEFIEFGDKDTEGTFAYLVENKNIDGIKNHFSIDKDGNLLVAKWGTSETSVSYSKEGGAALSAEEIASIPSNYRAEAVSTINVTSTPIDYKNQIKIYHLNYGIMSDLLLSTQNPEYCSDVSKLAFNSKIVISVNEELTHTEVDRTTRYTYTNLIRTFVKYNITGDSVTSSAEWEFVESGYGDPNREIGNRYNISDTSRYRIERRYNGSTLQWFLYRKKVTTNSNREDLSPSGFETQYGDLINNGQMDGIPYTHGIRNNYFIYVHTVSDYNSYKFEISEIDCWFLKYKKEYDTPKKEEAKDSTGSTQDGEYKDEITTQVSDTSLNSGDMQQNEDAVAFLEKKKEEKAGSYSNVSGSIISITVESKKKEDIGFSETTYTAKYKFGEEKPDTTEVKLKNVKIVDDISVYTDVYVDEDGNEQQEIGFLYIYDKYIKDGEDLFLKQDAEDTFFDMLNDTESSDRYDNSKYASVISHLLFIYDGIDRGTTELDLGIFKPGEFRSSSFRGSSAFIEWLRSYENSWLWKYRTGRATQGDINLVFERKYARENEAGEVEYGIDEMHYINDNTGARDFSLNYSYGIRLYDLDTGAYADESEYFAEEGIDIIQIINDYLSGKGNGWVNADALDRVHVNLINNRYKKKAIELFKDELGFELESYELDAFTDILYHFGEYRKPDNASIELLRRYKEGKATKEEVVNNFTMTVNGGLSAHPFIYPGDRTRALVQMFFEGKYIASNGEELPAGGEGILGCAKMVHDYMSDPAHLYYYCLWGSSNYEYVHRGVGLSCGLNNSFQESQKQGSVGYRLTCCATYVSWVLEEAGLIDVHNNGCPGLSETLRNANWIRIDNPADVEPGDVCFYRT